MIELQNLIRNRPNAHVFDGKATFKTHEWSPYRDSCLRCGLTRAKANLRKKDGIDPRVCRKEEKQ